MYVKRNISWNIILKFAWLNLIKFTLWSGLIVWAFHYFQHMGIDIRIPFLPLSTIGVAVAFYVGFKNNSSYDRFWEARKIWGGIVNYSRTWGNQVLSFISPYQAKKAFSDQELKDIQQELIYRHIAWLYALKLQLRKPNTYRQKLPRTVERSDLTGSAPADSQWKEEVMPFLKEKEYKHLIARKNTATQLIRKQGERLRELMEEDGLINNFRHMEMMRVQEEFYNLQGKCERIKNTPFPRQYAYFSHLFTWIFILLLPFGMVGEFAERGHNLIWLTVPFCVLISWIFSTMEIVGDNSEDPFENFVNDVPMSALCRTIEIDLREMLQETDLPPKVKPINHILM